MGRNPKDTVLVLSDNDPSRLPIFNALQNLGFSMEYSSLGRISPSPSRKAQTIVMVSDGCRAPAPEEVDRQMHADKRAKNEERANDYRC